MFEQLLADSNALVLKWHGVLARCAATITLIERSRRSQSCACVEFAHAPSDERGAAAVTGDTRSGSSITSRPERARYWLRNKRKGIAL